MFSENKLKYEQFSQKVDSEIKEYSLNICKLASQLSENDTQNRYICLAVVTYQLRIINSYCTLNDFYKSLAESSNRQILDNIRKSFSEIVILLKTYFDISLSREFSKNADYVDELDQLTPQRILSLLTQFEHLGKYLKNEYGRTSKFTIPVASLFGDTCGFVLNLIDIQKYFVIMKDLKHPDYQVVKKLLTLMEAMFEDASSMFIDAYSISDDDKEQIRKALRMLNTSESYCRLAGQNEKLPEIHRKKQSWERNL